MNEAEIVQVLEERGAILRGHFRLSSGRHSDLFAQKFRVLEQPGLAQSFGEQIASAFEGDIDVVVSPAVGALILGFCTAAAAHARFVFTERLDDVMVLRRGFEIAPNERVLVVEDVVTTGGSVREVVDVVSAAGGNVIGVGALIDRSDASRLDPGVPMKALVELPTRSWEAEACPLCAEGRSLDDPGSRRL